MARKDPEAAKAYQKEWYAKNKEKSKQYHLDHPEVARRSQLKRCYGLTLEQYNAMVEDQGGICKICDRMPKTLHVDHNHATGKVRGLLCGSCNKALGLMRDMAELLRTGATYLDTYNG